MSCPIPMIIAKQSWLNQTASLSATTVFTPSEDGDYRVNVYMTADTSSPPGWSPTLYWTDEYGSREEGLQDTGPFASYVVIIHAVSGQPIQVSVGGGSNPPQYDLFVTVVQE